jgi:hypothetical protein
LAIVIQPYGQEHEPAVEEFNRRLQRSSEDQDLVFSKTAIPRWLPPSGNNPVWNEFFVAVEGSSVRGAYGLKQEMVFIRGRGMHRVACYHHPLSEGIIDRSYASVGALLARDALTRQPLLYALGMGGYERPLPKMLKALGFSLTPIPFYFRVVHATKFLLEMEALRQARWRAILMNIAAATGAGWLAIKAAQGAASLRGRHGDFVAEDVAEFSEWADDLWNLAKETVSLAAVRDANTLRLLYPADLDPAHSDRNRVTGIRRLRISRNGAAIGWAIIGERRKDPKFGRMRVGSIVDCWAPPENTPAVVRAATQALEKDGVDVIVSNQSHPVWCRALERAGFLKGPSTFIFAASKQLTELLQPLEENRPSFHITRADGDGLPANF